jgi:hypothetical protein
MQLKGSEPMEHQTGSTWENEYQSLWQQWPRFISVYIILFCCLICGLLLAAASSTAGTGLVNFAYVLHIFSSLTGKNLSYLLYSFSIQSILFLVFSHIFIRNDQYLKFKAKKAPIALLLLIALGHISAFYVFDPSMYYAAVSVLICAPTFLFCYFNYYEDIWLRELKTVKKFTYGFENRVFFPVLLMTVLSMQYGIAIFYDAMDRSGFRFNSGDHSVGIYFYLLIAFVQLFGLGMFARSSRNLPYTHLLIPLVVICISSAGYGFFGIVEGKYVVAIYVLTYLLGFCESIRHMYYINVRHGLNHSRAESIYIPLVNWGAGWICISSLVLPVVFKEISFAPMLILYSIIFPIWLLSSTRTKLKIGGSFGIGGVVLTIVFFLCSITPMTPTGLFDEISKNSEIDVGTFNVVFASIFTSFSVISLSIALVRLIRDISGIQMEMFFKNIKNPEMYKTFTGPIFFLSICAMFFCIAMSLIWMTIVVFEVGMPIGQLKQIALRMLVSCVMALFIKVLCLLLLIALPGRVFKLIGERARINGDFK